MSEPNEEPPINAEVVGNSVVSQPRIVEPAVLAPRYPAGQRQLAQQSEQSVFTTLSESLQSGGFRLGILCGCLLLCFLANLALPSVFWDLPGSSDSNFVMIMGALGCLCAQFGFLAAWVGVGEQHWLLRIAICFVLAILLSGIYVVGLAINGPIPGWATVFIVAIALGSTLIMGGMILGLSALTQVRLVLASQQRSSVETDSIVRGSDIRNIAILTAVIAIALAVMKGLMSLSSPAGSGPASAEFIDAILVVIQGAFVCLAVVAGLMLLTLSNKWQVALIGLGILLLSAVVIIPCNLVIIHFGYRSLDVDALYVAYFYSFMFGFSAIFVLLCGILRLIGYRLGRPNAD